MRYGSIKQLMESEGAKAVQGKISKAFKEKKIKLDDISLKGLWESIIGDSSETMSFLNKKEGFLNQKEVQEADIRSSALSNIIGVVLANEMIDSYSKLTKVGDSLTKPYNSSQKDERVAGFVAMPDGDEVDEGIDYPEYGTSSKYVTTGDKKKRGGIVHITEETILQDGTGQLVEFVQDIAENLAMRKEKNIVSGVCGAHNCYFPLGVETALYQAAPYLVASNELIDWTDVEKAENEGLDNMTDELGEKIAYISQNPVLLVSSANKFTARRIVNATEITTVTDTAKTQTKSSNPLDPVQVISSRYVETYNGNATSWLYGDFKKQFRYKIIWPLQVFQLPTNNLLKFQRDIKFSFKVREWGWIFAKDQKYVVKNNA